MEFGCQSPFAIKDLMLGEFLCHAGVLDDQLLLKVIELAKQTRHSIGDSLCQIGLLTAQQLFSVRRLLNTYLKDPDSIDSVLSCLRYMLEDSEQGSHNLLSVAG